MRGLYFQGSVEFIESNTFHIDINVTSENVDELAKLHYNYTHLDGAIFLQLVGRLLPNFPSPVFSRSFFCIITHIFSSCSYRKFFNRYILALISTNYINVDPWFHFTRISIFRGVWHKPAHCQLHIITSCKYKKKLVCSII